MSFCNKLRYFGSKILGAPVPGPILGWNNCSSLFQFEFCSRYPDKRNKNQNLFQRNKPCPSLVPVPVIQALFQLSKPCSCSSLSKPCSSSSGTSPRVVPALFHRASSGRRVADFGNEAAYPAPGWRTKCLHGAGWASNGAGPASPPAPGGRFPAPAGSEPGAGFLFWAPGS